MDKPYRNICFFFIIGMLVGASITAFGVVEHNNWIILVGGLILLGAFFTGAGTLLNAGDRELLIHDLTYAYSENHLREVVRVTRMDPLLRKIVLNRLEGIKAEIAAEVANPDTRPPGHRCLVGVEGRLPADRVEGH
jgi:hypothetical protein